MTPVYVINRAADAERLERFTASAAEHGLSPERIPALDGHDPLTPLFLYRDLLRDTFNGGPDIKPGAFACYLSHMAAWRRFLTTGAEMALVCEDDATFTAPPAPLFAAAAERDFDVIFTNARMAAWRNAAGLGAWAPAAAVAAAVRPGEGDLSAAPGADAYVVSRDGARRLIEMTQRHGVTTGVDLAMIAAASDGALDAFVSPAPIAATAGPSVLRHAVTVPLSRFREAPEVQPLEGPDDALTRVPSGPRNDPVFAAFAAGRFPAPAALEMMRRWMPEGGVFVDIGAHAGAATLFMLRHGGAGRAIPLEFEPGLCDLLRKAIEANMLETRADLSRLGHAVGARREKRERKGSSRNPFAMRLRPGFVETAPVRPADSLLRGEPADMISIDVNGMERDVLKGLSKTLRRRSPLIVLRLSGRGGERAATFLARRGYELAERAATDDFGLFRPAGG